MTASGSDRNFSMRTTGTAENVRSILSELGQQLRDFGLGEEICGTVEIATAEALNNVIEHAYAPTCEGPVALDASLNSERLVLTLWDNGMALSGGTLPGAALPDASGPLETLPEGGFGWYLIRELTDALSYRREGPHNRLVLEFAVNPRTG